MKFCTAVNHAIYHRVIGQFRQIWYSLTSDRPYAANVQSQKVKG